VNDLYSVLLNLLRCATCVCIVNIWYILAQGFDPYIHISMHLYVHGVLD